MRFGPDDGGIPALSSRASRDGHRLAVSDLEVGLMAWIRFLQRTQREKWRRATGGSSAKRLQPRIVLTRTHRINCTHSRQTEEVKRGSGTERKRDALEGAR